MPEFKLVLTVQSPSDPLPPADLLRLFAGPHLPTPPRGLITLGRGRNGNLCVGIIRS